MKINKNLMRLAGIFSILLALTIAAPAQRSKRKKVPPKPKVVITDSSKKVPAAEKEKTGAEKVSIQIKNVSKFLYTLGGVARGIEDIDKDIKAGKASPEIAQKNKEFKQQVIQSIRNLRAGLITLESDFRIKNELKPYLIQIQGISNISGTAEDQAVEGQFTESGKTLLFVVEKLADTLAAMP
jgi:hypothetical protein